MRMRRDLSSLWGYRVWFDETEFDALMDEARERGGVALFASGSGVDVDTLLLRVHGITPDFAANLPPGILGRTLFYPDGRIEIELSRELGEAAANSRSARRRLRSTLAHECAHVVEHGHLHLIDTTGGLFENEPRVAARVLCRSESIFNRGADDWWEYQANRRMSSLLLPKSLVGRVVAEVLSRRGLETIEAALRRGAGKEVVDEVSEIFDASFEMTLYRLQGLGFIPNDVRQGALAFGE